MLDTRTTVKENGYEYAEKIAGELESQGCRIISIREGMVPRGMDGKGNPIMVPGYRITFDDGRPSLARDMEERESRWLWDTY